MGDSYEAVVLDFSSRWIRLAMNPTAAAALAAASGGWGASSSSSSRGGRGSSSNGRGGGSRSTTTTSRRWQTIWRLDLFANTVSHERCTEALHRFADAVTQGSGDADRQVLLSGALTQAQLQQQEALCRLLAGVLPPGEQHMVDSSHGA